MNLKLNIYSFLDPTIDRIENNRIARRIRLMCPLALLGFGIFMGCFLVEALFGPQKLIPWTLLAGGISLATPLLSIFVPPTLARILFITVGNGLIVLFATGFGEHSDIDEITIGSMALTALLFEPEELIPTLICLGQNLLVFLVLNFLNPSKQPWRPLELYVQLTGLFLTYFGVRRFLTSVSKSKNSMRSLIEALPDLVFTHDLEGRYLTYHSPSNVELILPPEQFLNRHYRECLPPFLAKKIDAVWKPLLETGTPQTLSYELTDNNGTVIHYEARLVLTSQNEVLCIIQNVTSRVQSEKARRESELRFRQIVETTQEGVWMLDENDRTTFANDRMAAMLGYSPDELQGRSPIEFVDPDFVEFYRNRLTIRKKGIPELYDNRFIRRDGKVVWMLISGSPILDEKGNYQGTIGMFVDITERKRMEAEIISSSKMSALGLMSSGIAHEINNPLTIIHGRAGQLRHLALSSETLDPRLVASHAEKIEKTAIRISTIVKALRSFSRESNGDPCQSCGLHSIIMDTLELCRERFRNNNISLTVDGLHSDCILECRPSEISQIILNLLNNAFDAVFPLHEKWVKIAISESKSEVNISVTDSGSGIHPTLHEKILQPFFTTKDVGKGTGLGLSVSKGLAESHGGRLYLDVDSPNTRFVLILPKSPRSEIRAR